MKLFKQAQVFAPNPIGTKDVLIGGGKILAIENNINIPESSLIEIIDTNGQYLVPGFVDSLVHITGGGGEGGYATRTPEMNVEEAFIGGVTTVIGVLGTDAVTRSLENLLAKAYGLEEQGLSVYCHTGSYHYPMVTITDCVKRDIMLIEKFIGVGEVAISDHRSSQMSVPELARLASETRVAGMLSGKAGIVSIHLGDERGRLSQLLRVVEQSDIPITQFYPTHVNRSAPVLLAGFDFALKGGYLDFTTSTTPQIIEAGEIPAAEALAKALEKNIDISQLTMSSDGNASLPIFDKKGVLIDLQVGEVKSLHQSMVDAVKLYNVPLELALASISKSPATILQLKNKGEIAVGKNADLNLIDSETLRICSVFAKGKTVIHQGEKLVVSPYSKPRP
jgi:beta-aspartyl-dipeptidase (metallo-type)